MSEDSEGREILDGLDIERFRKPVANEYDSAYRIWKESIKEVGLDSP